MPPLQPEHHRPGDRRFRRRSDVTAVREKHDGLGDGRDSVRLWLRLLSCAMILEKRLKRRFAEHLDTTLPRFDILAAHARGHDGMTMGAFSRALVEFGRASCRERVGQTAMIPVADVYVKKAQKHLHKECVHKQYE